MGKRVPVRTYNDWNGPPPGFLEIDLVLHSGGPLSGSFIHILVTTNLPFDEWTEVFGSERLTGALLDRLTHHVHILEMNGDSYRLKGSRQSAAALAPASDRPAAD